MDQRYETAREFFEALEEYTARQPVAPHGDGIPSPTIPTPRPMPIPEIATGTGRS